MVPEFAQFFRAVHGKNPFPWQERLARDVDEKGWPSGIGVPTGLGKTACIDVAVWALARQAGASIRRTAPTRIWYVVDRRLLIDAAYKHGQFLHQLLGEPENLRKCRSDVSDNDVQCIADVAMALRSIAKLGASPLHIVRLRGGADLGQRSPDPSQPTVIFATVAMYGSRLLFRGYGASRLIRPVDAALAGMDSLVLLDEAHIARPLMKLVESAAVCDIGDPALVLPGGRARPRLVPLTATADRVDGGFDLDEEDLADKRIKARIHASKPTALIQTTTKEMTATLARQARSMLERANAVVVFCNTAKRAREVHSLLCKGGDLIGVDTVLLTGRMREREAHGAREKVTRRVESQRDRSTPGGSAPSMERIVVVATQTLEVGADLDFDALVTECAGARALIQRFGRLNRLGRNLDARAAICGDPDAATVPPYGDEPAQVWNILTQKGELDLCPARISDVVGTPNDHDGAVGELLPAHLWEYAKTTVQESGEPDVELFFSERDDARRVSVAWRCHLPAPRDTNKAASTFEDDPSRSARRLEPHVRDDECVDVPIADWRQFAEDRGMDNVDRVGWDGTTLERIRPERIRPGDVVVLPASAGGYDHNGWSPESTHNVVDVRALDWQGPSTSSAPKPSQYRPILWLDEKAIACMLGQIGRAPSDAQKVALATLRSALIGKDVNADEKRTAALELISRLRDTSDESGEPSTPAHGPQIDGIDGIDGSEWDAYLDALEHAAKQSISKALSLAPDGMWMLQPPRVPGQWESVPIRSDAHDDLSSPIDVKSPQLGPHLDSVGHGARLVSKGIGLPEPLQTAVWNAGRYHDVGKADPRFQRLLRADQLVDRYPDGLLAKSAGRRLPGAPYIDWPNGARHEAVSAQILEAWRGTSGNAGIEDWDLILHLVISHHGYGRPLVRPVAAGAPITVEVPGDLLDEGTTHPTVMTVDLAAVDWEQPRRFRMLCERYGYWGLALLEAIVRQSDHAASAEVDAAGIGSDGERSAVPVVVA